MSTTLRDNFLLPLSQPFNVPPWNYNGMESVASIPPDVVDWVLLELRTLPDANSKIAARACFIVRSEFHVQIQLPPVEVMV